MEIWFEYVLLSFFVLMPIYDARWSFPRHRAAVERGEPNARVALIREAVIILWLGAGLLALVVFTGGPSFAELGLGFSGDRWAWIGMGIAALGMVQIFVEQRTVRRRPDLQRRLRDATRSIEAITPTNDREWRWFVALSLSAGFCEELLYRGFLFLWLQQWFGILPAAVLSSLIFGLGHAYQGWLGVVKTSCFGAVLMFLVWLSGSLWPAILLHAAIDLGSGRLMLYMARNPLPDGDVDAESGAGSGMGNTAGAEALPAR